MARSNNPNRKHLSLEDVLTGRGRPPSARELIELIREVNPSGLDLPPAQAARRYAQKSHLQSLLIRRFESDIDVEPDPRDPGVVSLRYRPLDTDACHAVLQELDPDARSWVQLQVDLKAFGQRASEAQSRDGRSARNSDTRATRLAAERRAAGPPGAGIDLSLGELLRNGQEAVDAYDYDLARDCLTRALELARGGAEAALPLLSLLVDCLAADQDALMLQARIAPDALKRRDIRRLLALAAARSGDRNRAEDLLLDQQDPAAVDVYVALAQQALDAGDLDRAARDVAQARQLCPTHAMLGALEATLAERRARSRRPLEDELTVLLAEQRLDEAETHARALRARWPDSAAAQRALREIDELRKADRKNHLLRLAEEALARGETVQERSLLQQALAMSLREQEAARVQKRLAEIDAAERAMAEQAREEQSVRLLGESDRLPGLVAYLALDTSQRARVRAQVGLAQLQWLDQMGAAAAGTRARAAAGAVLALERAERIVAEQPDAALELLSAHAKMLQGVSRSDEIAAEARRRLDALQKANAVRRLQAACTAFDAGAIDRARDLLAALPRIHLSEREGALADELSVRITNLLQLRTIERFRSDGAWLRARQAADKLLERLQGAERLQVERVREELDVAVRQAFRVKLHSAPRPLRSLRSVNLRAFSAPRYLLPDSGRLLFVETLGVWVFLQLADLASATILARVTLRTPAPVQLLKTEIEHGRVLLIGELGRILELSLADYTVMGWHERVGFETEPMPSVIPEDERLPDGRHICVPLESIRDAALVPGTKLLWLAGTLLPAQKCFIRVVDLTRMRVVREFREPVAEIGIRPLHELHRPGVIVVRESDGSVALYEPHGAPVEGTAMAFRAFPDGIVVYAEQQKILMFSGNTEKMNPDGCPSRVHWSVVPPFGGAESANVLVEDMDCAKGFAAAVDRTSGMVFVRVVTVHGTELIGLRACGGSSPGLERVFRVSMPEQAAMIQGRDGQGVVVLAACGDEIDVIRLGEQAPAFRPGPPAGALRLIDFSFWGRRCHRPTGAFAAASLALYAAMKDEPRSAHMARIDQAKRENNIDRIVELCYALDLCNSVAEAGGLAAWAAAQHPDHPGPRVFQARAVSHLEKWDLVRELLTSVDPSLLDEGSIQHFYHMLAAALLHLKEPGEALQALKKGVSCSVGRCDLSSWMALCTPVPQSPEDPDDAEAWTADQALIRMLMRAIQGADACLEHGDVAGARHFVDRFELLHAAEVQSLARLAEVYLLAEQAADDQPFDKAFVLASFCAAHAETLVLVRRELPLPLNRWPMNKLDDLSARATEWLNATLGAACPPPPGGF